MTIGAQLAAMKDEHAQGVQGQATQTFWATVSRIVHRLSALEVEPSEHDELVQRSVFRAWQMIHDFEYRGPDAFTGWLRRIVRYQARTLRRKDAARRRLVGRLEREPCRVVQRSPSSMVLVGERWRAVEAAKTKLGPRQRRALEFSDTHQLAKALGIAFDTARKQRRRAEKRLKSLLRIEQ